MPARLKRRIALLLLAVLAFAQVNVAMASCATGGGMMAMSMSMAGASDKPCDGCETPLNTPQQQLSSVCATHCATGDQPAAVSAALGVQSIQQPVLVLPRLVPRSRPTGLDAPPSGAPPRRILLHSFLI
jgi:hypothetical protein